MSLSIQSKNDHHHPALLYPYWKKNKNIRKTETHKVTLKGIEKTLGEPDDCTEGTELTLSIPEVGFEETPNDH